MSQPHYGRDMDQPYNAPGSVKRAREQAQGMLAREGSQTRPAKNRNAPAYEPRVGQNISRPKQVQQWPLANSNVQALPDHQSSRKQQQVPERPPRPSQSRIPSILDQSKVQQPAPVPVFTTLPATRLSPQEPQRGFHASSPSDSGSIPRKGQILGPPPSSRRGASSFYTSAYHVSPIPEESPRVKSQGSYASSAAMPDTWRGGSPHMSSPGYADGLDEESLTEKDRDSVFEEYGDESQLVRSASLGKKAKPALVSTKKNHQAANQNIDEPLSSERILKAYAAANSSDPADARQPTRLSTMRRPPRLDIDAVRAGEARGSLTSLPDLIRRATRLAAMMDTGNRPASRIDPLDLYLDEKADEDDHRRSGLSDMLAAFPPPVQSPRKIAAARTSWRKSPKWPSFPNYEQPNHPTTTHNARSQPNPRRRCCGLPVWAFVLVVLLVLGIIIAAIVVPLQYFVFKNLGKDAKDNSNLDQCQQSLTCLNGGTIVMSQGNCSCICTNGYTGSNCAETSTQGCTLSNLVSPDGRSNIRNVTLGRAIPRLLIESNRNFSIPLSGTSVLAHLNMGNMSCIAQNSLVTFDGRALRLGQSSDEVDDNERKQVNNAALSMPTPTAAAAKSIQARAEPSSTATVISAQASLPTTLVLDTGSQTSAVLNAAATPSPNSPFIVTEEKLDFARVAVLYILQEQTVDKAVSAQSALQQVFSKVTQAKTQKAGGITQNQVSNVDLGNGNSINLDGFSVNVAGKGTVGNKNV